MSQDKPKEEPQRPEVEDTWPTMTTLRASGWDIEASDGRQVRDSSPDE